MFAIFQCPTSSSRPMAAFTDWAGADWDLAPALLVENAERLGGSRAGGKHMNTDLAKILRMVFMGPPLREGDESLRQCFRRARGQC
jgi:hypothetical protein